MKFKNLALSLLVISSSLNINADGNLDYDNEVEEVYVSPDESDVEESQADTQKTQFQKIKSSIEMTSVEILFNTLGIISDLKDFYEKHTTFVVSVSAVTILAAYKLVKSKSLALK